MSKIDPTTSNSFIARNGWSGLFEEAKRIGRKANTISIAATAFQIPDTVHVSF